MRHRRRKFIALPAALLAVAGVLLLWPHWAQPPEPTYNGKTATEWLDILGTPPPERSASGMDPCPAQRDKAYEALRNMGTNAVPSLARALQYKTPDWKIKFYLAMGRFAPTLAKARLTQLLQDRRLFRHKAAERFLNVRPFMSSGPVDPETLRRRIEADNLYAVALSQTNRAATEEAVLGLVKLMQAREAKPATNAPAP